MIAQDVEVYSPRRKSYVWVEAIIDTGASICVIPKHIGDELGIKIENEISHLWQARDPLVLSKASLQIRYNGCPYQVWSTVVEIPLEYRRTIQSDEECTRPSSSHPMTQRMIVGENLLSQLSDEERQQILLL